MKTIPAKTLLGPRSTGERWFGQNYTLNLYRGCSHSCIYCDSRSDCYRVEEFDTVAAKENALTLLERELVSKRRGGIIGTGAMSDPYNPCEYGALLTRGALALMEQHRFGVGISTKSALIVRDIDLLLGISVHAPVHAQVTITTFDDTLASKIEPHSPLPSERIQAVRSLSLAGITTGILLMPVLPFICDTDENILGIVDAAHNSGARYIYPAFGMTLRDSQRAYYYERLNELFPGLSARYIKTYGNRYQCASPRAKQLWSLFAARCNEYGILYRMPDIVALIRGLSPLEQLRLF